MSDNTTLSLDTDLTSLTSAADTAGAYLRLSSVAGCGCPVCMGVPISDTNALAVADGKGIVQLDEQGFLLDVSNPASGLVGTTMPNGLPVVSAYESAAQILRPGGTWSTLTSNLEITYSFDAIRIDTASYAPFDANYQTATREILAQYASLTGLTFREVTGSTVPNIQFQNILGQQGGGGWASYPDTGVRYNAIGYPWTAGDVFAGSYVYNTILHEVGHSLGLAHPGLYNGSNVYPDDSVVWNDSRQYSVMSYNGAGTTGASFSGSAATPMLHDILAIQMEYGINWNTRTENTTYGFNSTTGLASYSYTAQDNTSAFCIWDGAGTDTLDFSGFSTDTVMDLREGSYSSTGVETYNVSIAYNAEIENAVGGSGNDKMRGNDLANVLTGGFGHDILYGGSETPVSAPVDPRDFTGISLNEDPLVHNQSLALNNVKALSGTAFSIEMMFEITRPPASLVPFVSYAVNNNSNELLIEGTNDGKLRLTIDGLAAHATTVDLRPLIDGEPHRLSMTWDSTNGAVAFYVDGVAAYSGTYTAAIGHTLATGGTMVFGQEQDSVGGGFEASQTLSGTIGDIRIFNDVRTAAEIAANAFTTLTGTEQGLIHNWQVQAGDTTTITDVAVANLPVNLTDLMPSAFTATQSSIYHSSFSAGNVLDNNTSTQNHTNAGASEWLLVSFNQPMDVDYVEVQNITGWGSRLNGATVSVLDSQGAVLYTSAPISGEGYYGSLLTFMLPETITAASAVRINHQNQNLHVAEVNVYGTAPAGVTVPAALLNTDLSILGGATVVSTAPVVDPTPDNDTLHGGAGNDTLYGGAGNDLLYGGTGPVSPFAATYGIALNQGVTDQYLGISNYGGLAGASGQVRFSIEMLVSGVTGYNELLSYASTQNSNAFGVTLPNNGNLKITYLGNTVTTGVSASLLADGGTHRFSLTWDNKAYVVYIDGVAVGNGTHTNSSTAALNGGGTLIFGQEQDSVGGGFDSGQILRGTVGDIRVFNDVRTAAEIAANAFAPLANPLTEQGLISNWQVTASSVVNGAVVDVHGDTSLTVSSTGGTTSSITVIGAWDNDSMVGGLGDDTLLGGIGTDIMAGGEGADVYFVSDASDVVTEAIGSGQDSVYASVDYSLGVGQEIEYFYSNSGSSGLRLYGNEVSTVFISGSGIDTLAGGLGNDTFLVNDSADVVSEAAAEGIDAVYSSIDYSLAAGQEIESLYATGSASLHLSGNEGANVLHSGAGLDTLAGGLGKDVYFVNNSGDIVTEALGSGEDSVYTSVDYSLGSGQEIEYFYAGAGSSGLRLTGNEGATVFVSGAGLDTLVGGLGNDTFLVNNSGDVVIDATDGGADAIYTSVDYSLGSDQEIEYFSALAGSTGLHLTGNSGANVFVSGAGIDTLAGGLGNDTFLVNNSADVVLEASGAGDDSVYTSVNYSLAADQEIESLYAIGSASLLLNGNSGSNVLYSGIGLDTLVGGLGKDAYFVNNSGDVVTEALASGEDSVYASIDYALGSGQEIEYVYARADSTGLRLSGNEGATVFVSGAGLDTLVGGLGNDTYIVNSAGDVVTEATGGGADAVYASVDYALAADQEIESVYAHAGTTGVRLTGNDGANVFYSGAGLDTLIGGLGKDIYFVNHTGDVVTEALGGGEDSVYASVDYSLGTGQEIEYFYASAGSNGLHLTGNDGANVFISGSGIDTLVGGLGNDTYLVNNAGDVVSEAVGDGVDAIYTSVDYTLGSGQDIESLYASGPVGLHLSGNGGANVFFGGAGNDTLAGALGNDTLMGGAGNDFYSFSMGDGEDLLRENDSTVGNLDTVLFGSGIESDRLWFQNIDNDLRISITGTSDSLLIDDWFIGTQYQVEQFVTSSGVTVLASQVDGLVSAMAALTTLSIGSETLTILPTAITENA